LDTHRFGHRQNKFVAFRRCDKCERDTRVAAGRFDDHGLFRERSVAFGGLNHRHADPVFHAAKRIEKFALDRDRRMDSFSDAKERLKKVPEWELGEKNIERTFEFDDFRAAIDFVDNVADLAEEEEHHPDIDIRWNKVRMSLSTHSKGGLTEMDFHLAERIDT